MVMVMMMKLKAMLNQRRSAADKGKDAVHLPRPIMTNFQLISDRLPVSALLTPNVQRQSMDWCCMSCIGVRP
jgi:hypothetical protein